MKRGGVLEKILSGGFDGDRFGGAADLEADGENDGYDGTNINVLGIGVESLAGDAEVVRVEGNVGERELAGVIGGDGTIVAADRVVQLDGCVGNDRSGGIGDRA